MIKKNILQFDLDKMAVSLSFVCAAQCLLLPISVLFLPVLATLPIADKWFHTMLLFFVVPISAFAMFLGCRKHKSYNIIFYGFIGLLILIISALWGHDLFGETGEMISTLIGTSILSYGHIQNQKLCKSKCH